jgi:hypothetical protein
MEKKIIYIYYYVKYLVRVVFMKLFKKNLYDKEYGKKKLSSEEGNALLSNMLCQSKPFMAGKYGSTELNTILAGIGENIGLCKMSEERRDLIIKYSGFFPNSKIEIGKLVDLYLSICENVDILAVWNLKMEDYLIHTYMKKTQLVNLQALEPFYFSQPWSYQLRGKKVLVIHPFAETIREQYRRRERLFQNPLILPEFKLITIKAVQTIAGTKDERFTSWFDALNYMYEEAVKCDFDIALIGCGAYGFPLALKIKEYGKQAIHIGGGLQILFGIKGKRWDNDPLIASFYNEYWVRPKENEKPNQCQVVEAGCYW